MSNLDKRFQTDPLQNFMYRLKQPLDAIFLPKTVAVIGAKDTEGSVGKTLMLNLQNRDFQGKVFPINPKRDSVFGLKCFPNIGEVPEEVDLAVIVTPASTVPGIVSECVKAKVKAAIIISAGFKELGPPGQRLEEEIIEIAMKGKMKIIGPNCLGVMNPHVGLNATFAKGMAIKGNIAFISQSGAMCTAVLDWSYRENIGFSAFVSIGSMADVNWGDLIDYLGSDPHTNSILMYMETVGNPRSFLTAAREIALEKPIIVIKAGKTPAAAHAAASHTGSLAGSDEVFDAALKRVGVLRVDSIAELFSMTSVLSKQTLPKGPNLAIVTNAGGPSVLATDAVIFNGAKMATLNETSLKELNQNLPPAWSHGNPVDILGDAGAERYGKTVDIISRDQKADGILVVLTPQDMTDSLGSAKYLEPYSHMEHKPLLASWMGGDSLSEGIEVLSKAGIPVFEYPDDAAKTFAMMWKYSQNLSDLYETPISDEAYYQTDSSIQDRREEAYEMLKKIRSERRTLLDEYESKKILSLYNIPVVKTHIATSSEEAVQFAEKLTYPIVVKLYSHTITHKTDVGGVKLNLKNADEVKRAFEEIEQAVSSSHSSKDFLGVTVQPMVLMKGYELILGSSVDQQFGPVVLFGTGGELVEVFKDRNLAIPPLNQNLARRLMEKTKIYQALKGVRGRRSVNLIALEEILVRFSRLVVEHRWIKECDINPLLASEHGFLALDARIVLYPPTVEESEIPKLAIRPYPSEYIKLTALKNGLDVTLRPIRPEDMSLVIDFHKELSENSIRQRYFEFLTFDERTAHERLVRICFNDYDRELAIVAEIQNPHTRKRQIVGAGRLSKLFGTDHAQMKMIITDSFHQLGLGTALLEHLIEIAKREKLQSISADVLSENVGMIKLCKKLNFDIEPDPAKNMIYVKLSL